MLLEFFFKYSFLFLRLAFMVTIVLKLKLDSKIYKINIFYNWVKDGKQSGLGVVAMNEERMKYT
jgi:hypothetical protein